MLKLVALLAVIFMCASAGATESYGMPKLDIGKGGQCVEEPQWMRINHTQVLLHQRDETVHQGIRDGKYSLKKCIECHASTKDNSVIARADSFCEGCHRYTAVKIDCFECHSSKRLPLAAQKASSPHSNSISKVKQGGDEQTTKTVHSVRLGVSEKANAVSPMKWNWNQKESK